ncbi:unnamed protein product [Peniophora sp. CBMAI 1063]|nr:unnamed protein product [Peniophora sp. CBMAI 1063]
MSRRPRDSIECELMAKERDALDVIHAGLKSLDDARAEARARWKAERDAKRAAKKAYAEAHPGWFTRTMRRLFTSESRSDGDRSSSGSQTECNAQAASSSTLEVPMASMSSQARPRSPRPYSIGPELS